MTNSEQELKPEYYVQRKPSGYLGNSPVWWAKDGKGYTAYILGAERFDKERAEKLVKENPDKWAMYRCDHVDERLHLVFDIQDKERLGTADPCGWESGYAPNPHKPTPAPDDAALDALGKVRIGYRADATINEKHDGYKAIKDLTAALTNACKVQEVKND